MPAPEYNGPHLLPDRKIEEEVRNGRFVLPLYGDLPSMPELERQVIFRMMSANEGLGAIGYYTLLKSGFDPDKDMLQAYGRPPTPNVRSVRMDMGGLVVDWNLGTNLEGLYAAGEQAYGTWGCAGSSTSGHWAGQRAAEYAATASTAPVNRRQGEEGKRR